MEIKASKRSALGKKAKNVRIEKKLPAAVYGKDIKSVPLEVDYAEFEKVYREAGQSMLIDLSVEQGKAVKVLVHEAQRDPVSGEYIHASFFQIDLFKDITATIPLELIGGDKCPAVVEGGLIVQPLNEIEIRCKPLELPHQIEIDVSEIKVGDTVAVADIKLPDGVRLVREEDKGLTVVSAIMPEEEKEEAPEEDLEDEDSDKEGEGEEDEGEKRGGKEGEKEGEEQKKPQMTESMKGKDE